MNEFTTGLSSAQAERLALLSEECGEVVQIIGKIFRHGLDSRNPIVNDGKPNRDYLAEELGHIYLAVHLLCTNEDIDMKLIGASFIEKAERIEKYLHYKHNFQTIGGLNGD